LRKKKKLIEFAPARVLVADDIADNRALIINNFADTPIEVESAQNGQEALNMFRVKRYDLVIMDIRMPVMDGYTAAKEMKKMADIPIIALGTEGLGFVAIGKTVSEVEDCDDPQWEDVPLGDQEKFRHIRPRIRARFELVNPNSDFRENEMISLLINRRQTLTPISLDEYEEFAGLVGL
jgi:hypothetical protein